MSVFKRNTPFEASSAFIARIRAIEDALWSELVNPAGGHLLRIPEQDRMRRVAERLQKFRQEVAERT